MPKPIAVLGAGSWGTALAILLARNGQTTRLWGHDLKFCEEMKQTRRNLRYLPGVIFPDSLSVESDLATALNEVEDVMIVVPSHAFVSILDRIKPLSSSNMRFVWGTKGIDPQSGNLLHTQLANIFSPSVPMAALAGPSFAAEVAMGLPTAVTIAANNVEFAKDLVERLNNNNFRVYTSEDIAGVEVAGLVKNIMGIAAGIVDGLNLGANALSAFITRGLAEMMRLGIAMGGKSSTFMGLAGVGDLILTCSNNQSRNRRFGAAIARGKTREQAELEIGQVVEGVYNLENVYKLSRQKNVEMPITEQVYKVIYEGVAPKDAITTLLARAPKEESL